MGEWGSGWVSGGCVSGVRVLARIQVRDIAPEHRRNPTLKSVHLSCIPGQLKTSLLVLVVSQYVYVVEPSGQIGGGSNPYFSTALLLLAVIFQIH